MRLKTAWYVLAFAAVLVGWFVVGRQYIDCHNRGGIFVESALWYHCAASR